MNKKNAALAITAIIIIAGVLGVLIWLNKTKQNNIVESQPQQIIKKEIQRSENPIIGEWFPLDTSRGGLGNGITFFEDGKVITKYGAYVHFKYKLDGNKLINTFPDTPDTVQEVEIREPKLIISSNGKKQELTRVAGDSNNSIIGKWTGEHYTGGKQIIDFTTSGNEYLSVPMTSEEGTYKISGNTIEFSRNINTSWQWSIDSDKFIMTSSDGKQTVEYVRIK